MPSLIDQARAAQVRSVDLQAVAGRTLVTSARILAETRRLDPSRTVARLHREVSGLRTAMESRAPIEQAKGIVMAATQCDADEAFDVLRRQSQHQNRRLSEVARDLVAATSRHRPAPPRSR